MMSVTLNKPAFLVGITEKVGVAPQDDIAATAAVSQLQAEVIYWIHSETFGKYESFKSSTPSALLEARRTQDLKKKKIIKGINRAN